MKLIGNFLKRKIDASFVLCRPYGIILGAGGEAARNTGAECQLNREKYPEKTFFLKINVKIENEFKWDINFYPKIYIWKSNKFVKSEKVMFEKR